MTAFFSWYILITLLGWLTFPLAYRLFPALMDRGYTLARAAGLLVWGFAFWWLSTLGFVHNDVSGLVLALFVLAGLSAWALFGIDGGRRTEDGGSRSSVFGPRSLFVWLRQNWKVILTTEILFLLSFAFLAFIRSANPDILGTEKPMELAFINGILRSPTFPPRDPWLSGYAISYYYFGYVLTAMLARMTSVPGTLAFNLMLALVFALASIGAYGILYNLLAVSDRRPKTEEGETPSTVLRPPSVLPPLLAPLFLLFISNVEGFLELLNRYGLFWQFKADGTATSPFWAWLDMKELSQAPTLPLGGMPQRFWWWWRASRVVQDYDLQKNFQEIIDEFPAFSFVLGDLHPHVLALPFGLLAVAVALNLYLGGWRGLTKFFGARLYIAPLGFITAAVVLGGLAFLNIWDILFAATLMVLAYILLRVRDDGWSWARLEDLLLLGIPLVASAILLYLPFYLGFSSQAGGLLPNLVSPTRGAHLWTMFGTLLLPIFAYLIYLTRISHGGRWRAALPLTLGLPLVLWALSWLLAWTVILLRPDVANSYLASQGVTDTAALFAAASTRQLLYIGGLLTLLAVLFPALAFLFSKGGLQVNKLQVEGSTSQPSDLQTFKPSNLPTPFILLLITLATLLVIGPDFLYLRDQFGNRMNTVFKFYYQAWMLWSLAASFGVALLLKNLRGAAEWIFRVFIVLLLIVGLTYPVMAYATKTNNLDLPNGFTLDDFERVKRDTPDEAAAIQYLMGAADGVIVEASIPFASYTGYARISTYTGLPTVLGWPMHESQWRGTAEPQGNRQGDIETLYTTPDWETARQIIQNYHIRYIVIGDLERTTYKVQDEKFYKALTMVFQQGSVTIYEAPQPATENR
jgi:YYY domain-containing protein